MTTTLTTKTKTTTVRTWGCRTTAYADVAGVVRVWDSVAGHYTTCHSLSVGQVRYVRARTAGR